MRVRVSPAAQNDPPVGVDLDALAYVIGVAIGDGNLSNPNGRATKLRVTCDVKYPLLIERIAESLQKILPDNKVNSVRNPRNCLDVYVHSNKLEGWLGWTAKDGPKHKQGVAVPNWIKGNSEFTKRCLKGLFETDGSVYTDRGYLMAMFVTVIPQLAADVELMITSLGFTSHTYHIDQRPPQQPRYNLRVSKSTAEFVEAIELDKR